MPIPMQKGRLGRGLASLIGEVPDATSTRLPAHGEQRLIPIADLHPSGLNPRKTFDTIELVELAQSIRTKGIVQPILARPDPQRGGFEIVAGERRWRAAQKAPLHVVPVIVRDLTDNEVAELAIIENVQRADLNPIEEAEGYNDLIKRFDYTQEQLAEVVGKSRSHLANALRLLKLPQEVQAMVRAGKVTASHARALAGRDDAGKLAERIVAQDMTVRDLEQFVSAEPDTARAVGGGSAGANGSSAAPRPQRDKDADTAAFEKDLSDALGLKVEIRPGSGESGVLTIKYGNFDQLDYIKMRLIGGMNY